MEKVTIKFDEDNLTLGDLEDFEDTVGVGLFEALKPVTVIGEDGKPERDEKGAPVQEVNLTAKALKALVWIVLRAERPNFTLEDARNVKVTALEIVAKDEDEADSGNDEAAPVDMPTPPAIQHVESV